MRDEPQTESSALVSKQKSTISRQKGQEKARKAARRKQGQQFATYSVERPQLEGLVFIVKGSHYKASQSNPESFREHKIWK